MGTTATSLAAGSLRFVWVAALEGYQRLLTNHATPADVITAFAAVSGGDYTAAMSGLFVELDNQQSIHPYEPFGGGGKCSLRMAPDAADTFGIETHRKTAGFQTELTETLDRNDTTVKVQSTSTFPTSGTIYIGTEAIGYTGVTATTFTGCTRGKYSPNPAYGSEVTRFGEHHRVDVDSLNVSLRPIVSSQPRGWMGKRVSVWMVRVSGGVLDVAAQAQLVYSGRITEIRDDPNSFATCIELRHVLDDFKEAAIGTDLWSAKIKLGVYLYAGMTFGMKDRQGVSLAYRTAQALTVTAGATGANQIEPGSYTAEGIHSALETWWTAELSASRLYGSYSIGIASNPGTGDRTKIYSIIPGAAAADVAFGFELPELVAVFFGFSTTSLNAVSGNVTLWQNKNANVQLPHLVAGADPLRGVLFNGYTGGGPFSIFDLNRVSYFDERGTFYDQFGIMPSGYEPPSQLGKEWGFFLVDGKVLVRAARDSTTDELGALIQTTLVYGGPNDDLLDYKVFPYDSSAPDYIEIRQIVILESSLQNIINSFCYSTGTRGYNSSTYDNLPYGFGYGFPGGMLGTEFQAGVAALPGASSNLTVTIDKPMNMADILSGDFMLRRIFPLWRNEGIRFGAWRSPTPDAAIYTLAESNKAEPGGSSSNHRAATTQTDEWQRPIIKIQFDRDFGDFGRDTYRDEITLYDRTAVDDMGGQAAPFTVKARNTGTDINALIGNFLSTMPMFSRPARKITRSIDSRFFETIAVGDVVLFSDAFARDPSTGIRGIALRPAIITKHQWNPGGAQPGSDNGDMSGTVELFFTDRNALLGTALYAPSADVDDTANTGGFTAGYNPSTLTIRCYFHRYNQTTDATLDGFPILIEENADASYFPATYKIKIIERDPADLGNPLVWERTVTSQSGDDIVLPSALAGFDTTKKYRVIFDDYDAVITAQRAKAFQGDDADGMILDISSPYQYGSGSADSSYEGNSALPEIEMLPSSTYADGGGRDVGSDAALMAQLDNLLDHKMAINSPSLLSSALTGSGAIELGFRLVYMAPIYLTKERLSNAVIRELSVGVIHRSANGSSATVRVSLCRSRPGDTTLLNVNRGTILDEMSRATSSTTWVTSTASQLSCTVKTASGLASGLAWLLIECSAQAECRGMHQCSEGIRAAPSGWVL